MRVPAPAGGALSFRRKCPKPFPRRAGRAKRGYPARLVRSGVPPTGHPWPDGGSAAILSAPLSGYSLLTAVLGSLYGYRYLKTLDIERMHN